jgi:hypothetical protein
MEDPVYSQKLKIIEKNNSDDSVETNGTLEKLNNGIIKKESDLKCLAKDYEHLVFVFHEVRGSNAKLEKYVKKNNFCINYSFR